jgi:hypothetical protein
MLEDATGIRPPNAPLSPDDRFIVLEAQTLGLRRAIQLVAREIDQTRDT